MKKIILLPLLFSICVSSQFRIKITAEGKAPKEAYIYTLEGSKDILVSKEINSGKGWELYYTKPYIGMMKVYLPELATSFTFISENKDVNIKMDFDGKNVSNIQYLDDANEVMNRLQEVQRKKESVLPILKEMKKYYTSSSDFYKAIEKEIAELSSNKRENLSHHPFVEYYIDNYNRFLGQKSVSQDDIIKLINNSDNMLESSSLIRPILIEFLKNAGNNIDSEVDRLLSAVDAESPRGQTILSELIGIFEAYGIDQYKEKYIALAKNMKCTLNDRLASTLKVNENTAIGATFANYQLINPTNTTKKFLHDIEASKKIIVFWSSTCSHCERDVPQFIPKYKELKSKGIEIIGFSLDTDKELYQNKVKSFPWINDSELKGWYSSYADKYNVHATPSYFILDKDNKIVDKPARINEVFEKLGIK